MTEKHEIKGLTVKFVELISSSLYRKVERLVKYMILQNSYIFLKNEEISQFEKDGRLVIKIRSSVFSILRDTFSIQDSDITDKDLNIEKAKIIITSGDTSCSVSFKCSKVADTTYLDVIVEAISKMHVIKVMELIHNSIFDKDNNFDKLYICIVSYDAVSEYYCNKLYPKLNVFERKLRRLMFNLYTVNFGKEYLHKTTGYEFNKEIQQKVLYNKSDNLKKKDKEKLLKLAFYSLDFYDIQTLLFDKRWTDYDEEQKSNLLTETSILPQTLIDKEPKSDWERFFVDKIPGTDIKEDFDLLRQKRNKVAHCKSFGKSEYQQSLKILNKLIKAIDKAILITEEKDFVLRNKEYISKLISSIENKMKQFTFKTTPVINQFQMQMIEITKSINLSKSSAFTSFFKSDYRISKIEQDEDNND